MNSSDSAQYFSLVTITQHPEGTRLHHGWPTSKPGKCYYALHIGLHKMSGSCDDDRHLTVHCALTSSVLLAQVGEPPDVTQAHREAHLGEDVLQLVVPGWSAVLSIWVRGG